MRFGVYELDVRAGELRKNGAKIRLPEQPLQILTLLLERPGEIVTREDICKKLWPDGTFVDFDHSLNAAVMRLREALEDSADNPRFIETIPRRGYRFLAPIESPAPASVTAHAAAAPRRRWWRAAPSVLLAVAAIISGVSFQFRDRLWGSARPPKLKRVTLMVLPVTAPGGSPELKRLAEAVTEAITTGLGRLDANRVGVVGATTARRYSADKASIARARQELGVDYLEENSLQQDENNVRLTSKLIRARDQTVVWAEHWDRPMTDSMTLLRDYSESAASAGELFAPRAESDSRAQQANPDLFIAAAFAEVKCWRSDAAVAEFHALINTDPTYSNSYAGLADCYLRLISRKAMPAKQALDLAKRNAQKALQLDPANSRAHWALARVRVMEWDFAGADQAYRSALRHSPSDVEARGSFTLFLSLMGKYGEAVEMARQSHSNDPSNNRLVIELSEILLRARRFDEAAQYAQKAIAKASNWPNFNMLLGMAYLGLGKNADAVRELEKSLQGGGGSRRRRAILVGALAAAGRRREAVRMMEDLRDSHKSGSGNAYDVAMALCGLGEKAQAIKWLERAYAEHESDMVRLQVDAVWDILRTDPRFQDLLRRMNFPK